MARSHPTRTLCDEAGFTLMELLVTMTLLVVIVGATLTTLDSSSAMADRENERTLAIREAQVGLDRIIRELRHTRLVHASTSTLLDVQVRRRGVDQRVRFDCGVADPQRPGQQRCTRTPVSAGGIAGTSEVVLVGLRNATPAPARPVFSFTPATGAARHVGARMEIAADGGRSTRYKHGIVLEDGTALRNVDVSP